MDVPITHKNSGTPSSENDLRSIIRKTTKGRRHIIASRMTRILEREVTPAMFADFCRKAPGKRHTRFPAAWVKAFCEAVGSDELARYLLPDSARRVLSASAGIVESREAIIRAQEALARVQVDLANLAEAKRQKKPQRRAKR